MTALFSCDMDIYSKGRLVIQNNPSKKTKKNKEVVLVIEIITTFFVNATHGKSVSGVCLGRLIHTSHSYTNTHTHTYVQIHHSHRRHACPCISRYVCGCVCTQGVCAKCVRVRLYEYPVKATLYTWNYIKMVVETIKYAKKKNLNFKFWKI